MVWLPIDPHFQQNPRLMFLSFYLVLNFVIKGKLVFSLFLAQKALVSFYFFFEYFDLSLGWKKICLLILQHCCNNIILHYLKCTLQLVKNNLPLSESFPPVYPFSFPYHWSVVQPRDRCHIDTFTKEKGLLINPKP